MNAADVLADTYGKWEMNPRTMDGPAEGHLVAALLAHGEQGVAILPDGTLRALDQRESGGWRLVPLSAEDAP